LIRSIRPVTETYNIALPVYTLSRGSLITLLNSTWPRLVNYSIFNISHYGRLLIRPIRPLTETCITISTNKHLFTVDY
ncbi:hypothetical protein GIB67_027830, partial [Kingdonia uniflora]